MEQDCAHSESRIAQSGLVIFGTHVDRGHAVVVARTLVPAQAHHYCKGSIVPPGLLYAGMEMDTGPEGKMKNESISHLARARRGVTFIHEAPARSSFFARTHAHTPTHAHHTAAYSVCAS